MYEAHDTDKTRAGEHLELLRREVDQWLETAVDNALADDDIRARALALIHEHYDRTLPILANRMQQTWYAVMVNEFRAGLRARLRLVIRDRREIMTATAAAAYCQAFHDAATHPPLRDDDKRIHEIAAVLARWDGQASLFYQTVLQARFDARRPMSMHPLLLNPVCRAALGEELYHGYFMRMHADILKRRPLPPRVVTDTFARTQRGGRTIHVYFNKIYPLVRGCVEKAKRILRGFVPKRARRTNLPVPLCLSP